MEKTVAYLQAALVSKTDEATRKDWQLKELQEMLFGQRSEKFVPDQPATQTAIQQTLGDDFHKTEIEAIIEQTITNT